MSNINKWIQSGSFSFLATAAQLGTNFLLFLILVRVLPEDTFGIWVLYLTIISFGEMARVGFVQNGLVKFCTDDPVKYPELMTAGFVMSMGIGLLVSIALIFLSIPLSHWWSAPELKGLIWYYLPYMLTFGSLRFVEFLLTAKQDFKSIFFMYSVFCFALLGLLVGFWFTFNLLELRHIVIIQSIAALLSIGFISFYKRKIWTFGVLKKENIYKLFHFGKFVFGSNFSSMLFNRLDIIMLGFFLTPAAVAVYNVATRISNYLEVPLNSMAMVIFPKLAEANKKGVESVGALYEKSLSTLLALTIPMAFMVFIFAKWIIIILAGPQYTEATLVLQIFVFAGLIKPWGRMFGITLDAIGKPALNLTILLLGLISNVFFNGLLIPVLGINGAALGTMLAIWVNIIIGQILISKIIRIDHWKAIKGILELQKMGFLWLKKRFSH